MMPPAEPLSRTASDNAGVGVMALANRTGIPADATTSAAACAKLGDPNRVS